MISKEQSRMPNADSLRKIKSEKSIVLLRFLHRSFFLLQILLFGFAIKTKAQNVTIIESQSYNAGHVMDVVWQGTAAGMGMNGIIAPQSILFDTTFFTGTDALIISSGVIILTTTQINTITQFMESGKSIYLQGEYLCPSYNTNTTFESLVNNYGGSLTLNGTIEGTLAPMEVLGTLGTSPNVVSPLSYFWYGCRATSCSYVEPFLEYNNDYFGFIFCPPVSDYGRVVFTSDQDWVNQSTSLPLMENILTLITTNTYQCSGQNFFSIDLGADTTICEDSSYVLNGSSSASSHLWSTGATGTSITVDTAGVYWVSINFGNCFVSDTIVILEVPCNVNQVDFNSSDTVLCEKFCIDFFDNSSANPTEWLWNFEGASPSSSLEQHPENICYDVPGTYDVTLITTHAAGSDTLTLIDYITVNSTPPFPTITQNGNILTSSFASFYQWQFNAVDITGATNQSHTITQSGLYTVIISDLAGCKNSANGNFIITGMEEVFGEVNILIYPNPSSGSFTIELLNHKAGSDISISISNALGQKMLVISEKVSGRVWKKEINLDGEAKCCAVAGTYLIEVKIENSFMRKKLLISR